MRESATAAIFRRVAELRARGEEVFALSLGETEFEPPKHVRDAAHRAIDDGGIRYTEVSGLAALRHAITNDSLRRRGVGHAPDEVVVSAGAKHALFNLAQVLFDHGDEVVIPTPAWGSYAEQARLCGAEPVFVPCAEAGGFLCDPDALRAALGPRTRAVILCDPSNPTGAVRDAGRWRSLADVLRAHSAWIVVDEIYAGLTHDGHEAVSLLKVAPDLRDRIVIVDGVSKRYAMTGWRAGWLLAPRALARACAAVQSQATTSIATVSQRAVIAALEGPQDCVATMREELGRRRDRMLARLADVPGVGVPDSAGAFYVFANVQRLVGRRTDDRVLADDVAIAEWLLAKARVATVPGSAFHAPGYLRLSYSVAPEAIDRACDGIARAVASLGAG
jgi:aspartate aminotransferase